MLSYTICVLLETVQATIMTDPGMADATYVGPMTPELVEQILDKVRHSRPGVPLCLPAAHINTRTHTQRLWNIQPAVRGQIHGWCC